MADSHPYISGAGNITQMVNQLRKSFPKQVTSDTVKKLGLASNNESYVINALQFVGLLEEDGKQTEKAKKVFSQHKDEEFAKSFSTLVEQAYSDLFELHGQESWSLGNDDLITFFRQSDQTSEAIGKRQSATFKVFAALSGHAELPTIKSKSNTTPKPKATRQKVAQARKQPKTATNVGLGGANTGGEGKDIGLTVRVEINLPADGSKETYDNIFKSIKENLLNG